MYRKHVETLIVRDVRARVANMRKTRPWVSWRHALIACQVENEDWFKHHPPSLETQAHFEKLLRDAGVDMSIPDGAPQFVGNERPTE
jgi:hypothetical protein